MPSNPPPHSPSESSFCDPQILFILRQCCQRLSLRLESSWQTYCFSRYYYFHSRLQSFSAWRIHAFKLKLKKYAFCRKPTARTCVMRIIFWLDTVCCWPTSVQVHLPFSLIIVSILFFRRLKFINMVMRPGSWTYTIEYRLQNLASRNKSIICLTSPFPNRLKLAWILILDKIK